MGFGVWGIHMSVWLQGLLHTSGLLPSLKKRFILVTLKKSFRLTSRISVNPNNRNGLESHAPFAEKQTTAQKSEIISPTILY